MKKPYTKKMPVEIIDTKSNSTVFNEAIQDTADKFNLPFNIVANIVIGVEMYVTLKSFSKESNSAT